MFIDRRQPRPAPRAAAGTMTGMARGGAVTVRCVTALVGGYGAAAVLATLLARLLPGDRAEATTWGLILSFLLYAAIGLWCFHERRLGRIVMVTWGIALAGAALLWWLGVRP
jgi:hypothetical protein